MTDDEIREAIRKARSIAAPVGPMHSYWDVIFDAEALLEGKPTIVSRAVIEDELREIEQSAGELGRVGQFPG